MTQLREAIKKQIGEIPRLATLPTVAIELTQLIEQQDVSVNRIKKLLETDPSLTLKVLQIANSPFYGSRSRIYTIDQALALIGLNELSNILLSVSMYSKLFHGERSIIKDMELLWHHSIGCAYLSRSLTSKFYINTAGREYVAGLLHDIGKIVLIEYYSKELELINTIVKDEGVSDLIAEERILGVTHEDIGSFLADAWRLPQSFKNVIKFHHAPRQDNSTSVLSAVVHVADFLCRRWGVVAFEGAPQTALINDEGWQVLMEEQSTIADADPERVAFELKQDLISARVFSDDTIVLKDDFDDDE